MSVTIRAGYQAVISSPGWGDKELFAPTLEQLDLEVEAYLTRLEAAKESRLRAALKRVAGRQRQMYRDARAAFCGPRPYSDNTPFERTNDAPRDR